jgi:hypothetical protein
MEDGNHSGYGTHKSDLGLQSANAQLLSGWAPGNQSIPLGKEVGMQCDSVRPTRASPSELHYYTDANPPDRKDRSGARLCLTSKLRPKEAGTHSARYPGHRQPAALRREVRRRGHLHDQASEFAHHRVLAAPAQVCRAAKTLTSTPSAAARCSTKCPFDFTDSAHLPVTTPSGEVVVKPGDVLTTTCTYDATNLFTFGPGPSDEMCLQHRGRLAGGARSATGNAAIRRAARTAASTGSESRPAQLTLRDVGQCAARPRGRLATQIHLRWPARRGRREFAHLHRLATS